MYRTVICKYNYLCFSFGSAIFLFHFVQNEKPVLDCSCLIIEHDAFSAVLLHIKHVREFPDIDFLFEFRKKKKSY